MFPLIGLRSNNWQAHHPNWMNPLTCIDSPCVTSILTSRRWDRRQILITHTRSFHNKQGADHTTGTTTIIHRRQPARKVIKRRNSTSSTIAINRMILQTMDKIVLSTVAGGRITIGSELPHPKDFLIGLDTAVHMCSGVQRSS